MRRPEARWWSANGKTAKWRSVTVASDCAMKKSRCVRRSRRRRQPSRGSTDGGCRHRHRPATHGEKAIDKSSRKGGQHSEKRAVEMADGGKRGNPKAGFPLFPPFLGNLANSAKFPHFPSSGGSRRMEKWKTKSRFPTSPPPPIPFL